MHSRAIRTGPLAIWTMSWLVWMARSSSIIKGDDDNDGAAAAAAGRRGQGLGLWLGLGLGLGLEKRSIKHLLGLGRRAETGIETETER